MSNKDKTLREGVKAILAGGAAGLVIKDTSPTIWADLLSDLILVVLILAMYVATEHVEDFATSFWTKLVEVTPVQIFGKKIDVDVEVERSPRPYSVLSSQLEEERN